MIITQTPLRVSFLGGGTDFAEFYQKSGGAVVSTAINKFVYVIVKERFDDLIVVNYSQRETVSCVADLKHELVREAMRIAGRRVTLRRRPAMALKTCAFEQRSSRATSLTVRIWCGERSRLVIGDWGREPGPLDSRRSPTESSGQPGH